MSRWSAAAWLALSATALAVAAGLLPVLWIGWREGLGRGLLGDGYVLAVARFTLLQAGLSTLLSVALGLPLALALNGTAFPGRPVALAILAMPQGLPAIAAILGLITVFGRSGWLPLDLYGLTGILLAHVFFNMPLAARMYLDRLQAVPPESLRLADQLGFGRLARFRFIEWPAIAATLPGTALLIFLLCAASFAVVLTLGGGPATTTIEVAIYQALRFDYDPARAGSLALIQLVFCFGLVALLGVFAIRIAPWSSNARPREAARRATAVEGAVIASAVLFVAAPVAALAIAGAASAIVWSQVLPALATSLGLATVSALLCMALAWPLARAAASSASDFSASLVGGLGLLTLTVPPAVLATGWFLLFRQWPVAPLLVVAMNALMALPFALGVLAPALRAEAQRSDRLCASLGLEGFTRFRLIDLPALKKPVALAAMLAAVASLGDLTAIALFGTQNFTTLPALVYSQLGSYRFETALGSALVLALVAISLSLLAQRLARAA